MPIERANVTNQVVEYFKGSIRSGEWQVGERIPSEHQLTEILGVSRVSVRAAIRHFVGLGVLETVHGKGTYLISDQFELGKDESKRFTADDCRDMKKVNEFREIIEKEACYLAVLNTTDELVTELKRILDTMVANVGNQKEFVQADIDFHLVICEAADNPLITKCMRMVYTENTLELIRMNERFGYKDGIYYHTLILQAFESGDADLARDYMQEHLSQAAKRLDID